MSVRRRHVDGTVVAIALVGLASCGNDSDESSAPEARIVEVSMTDFAFTPASFEAEEGDLVIFRFTNDGTVNHEAVIGDEMFQTGHMDHQHLPGETMPGSVVLAPGGQADVPYVFSVAGTVLIGCHVDDHWDLGMRAEIDVALP